MKTYGKKTNFTSPSSYMKKSTGPKPARIGVIKSKPKDTGYKIPKTPKTSGKGWGY